MASVQSFIESFEALLTCSVCKKTLNGPKTLPGCLHTFCFKCIEGLNETYHTDEGSLKCPVCKTAVDCEEGDISRLPSLTTYNSLLRLLEPMKKTAGEVQQQQHPPQCTNCSKRSALAGFCLQCEGMICGDCINYHKTLKIFKRGHQATVFKDFNQEIFDSYITNRVFCKETLHEKNRLEFYCKTCKKCICYLCKAQSTHSSHNKVSIEEAAKDAKSLISQEKERLNELLIKYQRQLELSDEKTRRIQSQVDAAKAKVRNRTQAMIATLQNHQDDMMATLDKIFAEQTSNDD
ncbi:E3 ubiquitin-protein ligase TRIM71 [Exaiptasia diaphana]|uniref:Uncharacterized protein n=1 Tax=Exaiptasia diaphana TaxID=2652724 RepID=A0A913XNQ7_EXADI|nr:E3 ubiquitin-protein ligase TRIM71 [Exaiptasia diaphana]